VRSVAHRAGLLKFQETLTYPAPIGAPAWRARGRLNPGSPHSTGALGKPIANFLSLTKVRPASDINALPSHTTVKATTGRKEQFKTVAHPAAHAEEGLSSKKRGQR
jgi:hypothetical protein